jgi:hypothetical protein
MSAAPHMSDFRQARGTGAAAPAIFGANRCAKEFGQAGLSRDGRGREWRCLLLCLHELAYQGCDLIGFGIEREVSCFEYVDFCVRYVLAVAFGFASVEGEIVFAPDDQ